MDPTAGERQAAPGRRAAIAAVERAGWAQSRLIEDLLDIPHLVSGRVQLMLRTTAIDSMAAS